MRMTGSWHWVSEQLVQIFADFALFRFHMTEANEQSSPDLAHKPNIATSVQPMQHSFTKHSAAQNDRINLNTASFEQLRTLPHIGFDRALDILILRPITDLSQLIAHRD